MGSLEYHLRSLEDAGLVTVEQAENKRYFPSDVPPADRPLLALLRQEIPRRAILLVLERPDLPKSSLLAELRLPPSTLNYHLRRLEEAGLLSVRREGRDAHYTVEARDRAIRLLVTYRTTILDRWIDAFLETTGLVRLESRPNASQNQ